MVTIKDVARESGVAISTVSNVLNNVDVVSDETREKVMAAVKKLNYIPNMNAKLLKANRKNMIGLFVEDIQGSFYNTLIQAIHLECKKRGYLLNIYVCSQNADSEVFSIVASSGVAAAIVINTLADWAYVERLLAVGLPLVFMDREKCGRNYSSCVINNYEGAKKAAEYLIAKGKRRIGYIHGFDNYDNRNRYRAYLHVLERHGLSPCEPYVFSGNFREESTYEELKRVLKEQMPAPDAIFCASDSSAFGCIKALQEEGIRVPEELSIIGFDDCGIAEYYIPPLTTIHSPIAEMGVESAREAIRLAAGKNLAGSCVFLPTYLVERGSVR